MLYRTGLRDLVLIKPIRDGADQLKIVSGYATHTMASWHMTEILDQKQDMIEINLIVGMCRFDGLAISVHNGFKELVSGNNRAYQSPFTCQYVTEGPPVHSKIYLWEKDGRPFRAYVGSANYTQAAFSPARSELLHDCDPNQAREYYDLIESRTTYCNHAEIEDVIMLKPAHPVLSVEESPSISLSGAGISKVKLSLLTNRGDVGFGSGINWGHRRNRTKRNPNEAYIPLPAKIARSGFFPLERRHFTVLTDDQKQLILRVQQDGDKAITTPQNNSLLGEYLRNRIGVANGAFVTKQDLLNYGRTDVTFYKLDEEQFYMDFSTEKPQLEI